jgi:hypothetical protein
LFYAKRKADAVIPLHIIIKIPVIHTTPTIEKFTLSIPLQQPEIYLIRTAAIPQPILLTLSKPVRFFQNAYLFFK